MRDLIMGEVLNVPKLEDLKYLDLTPENVEKVFLYCTVDADNKKN